MGLTFLNFEYTVNIMEQHRTQYQFYEITVNSNTEHSEILNFAQRYPQVEVRNMFSEKDYLGLYPRYFEVVVEDETSLKLAFIMQFPQAKLRTIINCVSVALG